MIEITFGSSASPNYQHALLTPGITTIGSGKGARHAAAFDFADLPKALSLWDMVGNWKTASFSADGQELDRAGIRRLQEIYDCWKKGHDLPNTEAYCRPVRPRPHQPEDEIQRALTRCRQMRVLGHGFSWLEHGYVTLAGGWAVDKAWLRGQVENELWQTRADLCPLFDRTGMEQALEDIPEEFDHSWIVDGPKRTGDLTVGSDNVIQFRRR